MPTKVKIYKTVKSTIDKQSSLVDGLYFTTDTHELIVSVDSEKFNVTDIEILKTESSRKSLLAPLTKFYYVLETNTLWYYDGSSWKSSVNIINNLTSTDTAAVLSAAMGKKLNDEKLGKTESASSVKGTLTLTRGSTTMTYNGSENKSFSIPDTPKDVGVISTAPVSGQVAVFDGTTGKIKSTGFTLLKSVPADAKFTDTVYTHPKSGITAGSYRYVTVDDKGHIIKGSNPTTLAEFGITDAASKVHNHDASSIVSGIFDIERIPKAAIPVLCRVTNDAARFKLTANNVQNGDTVKVESTGKMYYVVDQNKLSTESGYEPYTADVASSVPWSGITGKPSTYTPSAHTHTKSQITDFPSSIKNPNSIIIKLNSGSTEGTNLFTYDGSAGKTINITPSAIGAAASTHTHTKSQITDFPTAMPASDVYSWAKASTKPTYTKSEVGLGNVDNTADANKSVKYATSAGSSGYSTRIQTFKQGSTTETYGSQYPVYAQWEDSNNVRFKCDGYTIKVAYADSAGTASKLDTNAGNTTTPVYFSNGIPVALGYTIAKSVPANAKFTDTVYTHPTTAGNKHIPSGGSANQILKWSADGTAVWGAEKTYSTGNTSTAGITKLYTGTGSATDGTLTQKAITDALSGKAPSNHDHKYAGSSSAGGSANSAVKLATARSINGTSFDGSGDITTAKWGTARDITVGNTSKSVNGSGNISWSLAEIGIHLSTTEPTPSDGKNGDIWIVYE